MMRERSGALSEREKETLRLLLKGHDAKSIASTLELSVHTVNERLREARRKLGVGSSREAARILAQSESPGTNFLEDKQIGVVPTVSPGGEDEPFKHANGAGHVFAWLSGGIAIMLAIAAALAISVVLQDDGRTSSPIMPTTASASSDASDNQSATAAEQWAELIDQQRWGESWHSSGSLFRAQLTEDGWTATIQPLRQQLGAVASRSLESVSSASSLPGAPAGDYKIVQFDTVFANKADAVETVILSREGSAWHVNGYFIR